MPYFDQATFDQDSYTPTMFEQALLPWMTSQPSISARVGTRLYPGHAPDKAQTPYIVSYIAGADSEHCHDSRAFLNCRVQFSIFATTYHLATDVRDALMDLLDGYSGPVGLIDPVQVTAFHASTDSTFERDTKLHHIAVDFDFAISI